MEKANAWRFPLIVIGRCQRVSGLFLSKIDKISEDKHSLSPDRFNVNSNEFLMSVDAVVSDTGAQRSVTGACS